MISTAWQRDRTGTTVARPASATLLGWSLVVPVSPRADAVSAEPNIGVRSVVR